MEKLCILPKDLQLIEKEIVELWSLLEGLLEIWDEVCMLI